MADDWDLYAIVRSCSSSSTPIAATPNANRNTNTVPCSGHASLENHLDCLAALTFDDDGDPFAFPSLVQPRNYGLQELQDSYKPFLSSTHIGQDNIRSSFVSDFGGISTGQNQSQQAQRNHSLLQLQQEPHNNSAMSTSFSNNNQQKSHHVHPPSQQQKQNQRLQLHQQGPQRPGNNSSAPPLRITQSQAPRSRKKKSHQKRLVVHVPAENLSNDVWAWRKYGQKPIKGSPYPRNYYRCSSSKGCAARKQVERSNTDPGMFIVSYTGDHTHPRPTHRNSLAGSTRSKFPTFPRPTTKESEASSPEKAALSASPVSGTSFSPTTPQSAAPVNHEAADENTKTESPSSKEGADDMEAREMETDDDDDDGDDNNGDDHDDDDDILIPNMALNEDLIKGLQLQKLGSSASQESNSGGLNNFSDNFSSWTVGCSNPSGPSGPTARGGC